MSMKRSLAAGMLGFTLTIVAVPSAQAETLKIVQGTATSALTVPMNRAVIVEADQLNPQLLRKLLSNFGFSDPGWT